MRGLAPYDAVMVVSYGGPRGPEDVMPFLRNATRGRGIPDERLAEVGEHYFLFDGVSPINDRNAELIAAIEAELAARDAAVPVVIGNRNWTPYVGATMADLVAAGAERVLVVLTAAYASYSGCRQYREDIALADRELGGTALVFDKIGPYAESAGFIAANADAVVAALRRLTDPAGATVLFVTHSIPLAMDAASGPGGAEHTYRTQHERVAERVAAQVAAELGFAPTWELVYCSRSGAPHIPWLEPDIDERLAELAAAGVSAVVASPIGFINDHMEVVYDLDTQAAQTASGLGLEYVRADTVGTHPAFVGALVDQMLAAAAVARGERTTPDPDELGGVRLACSASCCRGRPGGPPTPAACAADE